jgi:hypothetical protein
VSVRALIEVAYLRSSLRPRAALRVEKSLAPLTPDGLRASEGAPPRYVRLGAHKSTGSHDDRGNELARAPACGLHHRVGTAFLTGRKFKNVPRRIGRKQQVERSDSILGTHKFTRTPLTPAAILEGLER